MGDVPGTLVGHQRVEESIAVQIPSAFSVAEAGGSPAAAAGASGRARSRLRRPSRAVMAARSMTFCSSRTFPGH